MNCSNSLANRTEFLIRCADLQKYDVGFEVFIRLIFYLEKGSELPGGVRAWLQEAGLVTITATEASCLIPKAEFFEKIPDLVFIRSRYGNFQIDSDSYVDGLMEAFHEEKRLFDEVRKNPEAVLPPDEVIESLTEANFLRAHTQSNDQIRDIGRLLVLPHGANFSVPGAGKTNALLAVHSVLKLRNPDLKLLVISPKNAMISWDEELRSCLGSGFRMQRLEGGRVHVGLILRQSPAQAIISYQQARTCSGELEKFMQSNSVHLVLDESHRIKAGGESQQGSVALKLGPWARRRDILSGTPMPQGLLDLVPQFKYLWPTEDVLRVALDATDLSEQLARANRAVRPFFVRTTKSELGLPPVEIRHLPVPMSELQSEIYALLKSETARFFAKLDRADKQQMRQIGQQIMRVLQFCSDPELLLDSLPDEQLGGELAARLRHHSGRDTPKFEKLDSLVRNTVADKGGKIVIWSMFVGQIEKLVRRYGNFGALAIHGGIPTGPADDIAYREARIEKFKSDATAKVLVANPAACGEGISLHTAAHHAVYVDRSFNAAHFLQSIDRIHRRGLPKEVETRVDILVLEDTLEEVVRDRLSLKVEGLRQLLEDDDLSAMVYDPDDQAELGVDHFIEESDFEAVRHSLVT